MFANHFSFRFHALGNAMGAFRCSKLALSFVSKGNICFLAQELPLPRCLHPFKGNFLLTSPTDPFKDSYHFDFVKCSGNFITLASSSDLHPFREYYHFSFVK